MILSIIVQMAFLMLIMMLDVLPAKYTLLLVGLMVFVDVGIMLLISVGLIPRRLRRNAHMV